MRVTAPADRSQSKSGHAAWRLRLVALCVVVCPGASFATKSPDHAHEAVSFDGTLSLSASIDAALQRYPETVTLDARSQDADAWQNRGRSMLAARPAWNLRVNTDRFGSDEGLDEYEAGVDLPLWSPGGRRAVQAYGKALRDESVAARSALRWAVAGEVRVALWQIAFAVADADLAAQTQETAAQLLHAVERRHELGDLALADLMLTRSSYLESESALIRAEAELQDAERSWRFLTGLDRRPGFTPETAGTVESIGADHPALLLANSAVARAEADVAVAGATSQAGPTVFLGARRERPANGTILDDSIGVIVSVPFGGGSHRQTEVSAAASVLAAVRADRDRQFRELTMALHETAHRLRTIRASRDAAQERLDIADRQEAMAAIAYEKGEIDIMDLLRIRTAAIAARRNAVRLDIEEQWQKALYNQAAGDIP